MSWWTPPLAAPGEGKGTGTPAVSGQARVSAPCVVSLSRHSCIGPGDGVELPRAAERAPTPP